jgi:anaerobic nitric oxide reductase flavorubredoxin
VKARAVSASTYVIHADVRTTDLFEGIWPIPDGVSLNSYLVKGEKTVLIDLVRDWAGAVPDFTSQLAEIGIVPADIDYLVLNHMEPDHTGWLREFRAMAPKAEILASEKALPLIKNFYGIEDRVRAVAPGEKLDIGKGLKLAFEMIPNVHWPETMATYLEGEGVLFSCDAFGSFGALDGKVFDDELGPDDAAFFEKESLRYYANIIASFSVFVQRAIQKLGGLSIKAIAPSHGPIYRKDPGAIVSRYAEFASWMNGPARKEICVIWGSMYGNTKAGLDAVISGIRDEGLPYSVHRVPNEDISFVLADAYKCAGIVIGAPTYEYRLFPPMAYVLDVLGRKHVWNRRSFRFGSYGWSGGAKKDYEEAAAALKWTDSPGVEWAGAPDAETLSLLAERGRQLAKAVKEA